ncbi:MAG: PGF-pre-PGF domain-containing protein [Candidatus Aenigmatarchaeota archaeon]
MRITSASSVPFGGPKSEVYKYLEIIPSGFDNSRVKNATISFPVDSLWLEDNEFIGAVLLRHDGDTWVELETIYLRKSGGHHYYVARLDHFSFFAIVGKAPETCTGSQKKCTGSVIWGCYNSSWRVLQNCPQGCNKTSLECNYYSGVGEEACENGEWRCLGNDSQICWRDYWITNETCEFGCDNETALCRYGNSSAREQAKDPPNLRLVILAAIVALVLMVLLLAKVSVNRRAKEAGRSMKGEIDEFLDREKAGIKAEKSGEDSEAHEYREERREQEAESKARNSG